MIKELDTVVLTHDILEYGLVESDLGAVVHVYSDGQAYEVEFVAGEGKQLRFSLSPSKMFG